jgi:hypothetical protein
MSLNWLLGIEIYVMHVGHFLLFIAALVILSMNVPWWAALVGAPLAGFSVLGWLYEASIVLPVARQLFDRDAYTRGGGSAVAERLSPNDELSE